MIKYKPSEILQYFLWADPPFLNIGLLDSVYTVLHLFPRLLLLSHVKFP